MNVTHATSTEKIPLIDQAAPDRTETATLAMG
jgi:hypothetical protein